MFKKILIILIKFYQKAFSFYNFGCCRFVPTCSNYAIEATERFGFFKGLILIFRRLLRCNIFSKKYGYDPVPQEFNILSIFKNKNIKSGEI